MAGIPTFATAPGFLGRPTTGPGPSFTVAGIPLDIGVTNRAGARSGPGAIRQASRMLVDGDHPHFWTNVNEMAIADMGEFEIALGDLSKSLALIQEQAVGIPHLLAMGGEHGITLPLLRALRQREGTPLALIHFDAHVDTWDDNFGQVYGHGSVFYHAIREGLVDPRRMIQIGIRSPVQRDVWDWTVGQGVTILSAQDVHAMGVQAVARRIGDVVGRDMPTYLTYDVDCLDPAFAPGTGTPEIGGLATWQTQAIIRQLTDTPFIGMDVVEVLPAHDVSETTALAAATVMWEYLALLGRPNAS
ncbi:MAG TPA: agmatinase [Acidisoma sp.]|uniref:agmatinase n=1 Tax=Acidisoma sp. TaxID=1872115 RepID=UPI002CF065C9|nr:agmatinase [Acidisoma sp.]HTI02943.1 agmatinase [Acidisoma sp.]